MRNSVVAIFYLCMTVQNNHLSGSHMHAKATATISNNFAKHRPEQYPMWLAGDEEATRSS